MKRTVIWFGLFALCLLLTVPANAADKGWHLRAFAAGFDPDLDVVVPAENPDEIRVTAESDLGYGASLEYQFSSLLGLEAGFFTANPKIVLSAEDVPGYGDLALSDSMSATALVLDLNFHLTPGSEFFDLYVGAGLTKLSYGDLQYDEPDGDVLNLAVDDDLTYSAKVGLGIAFGRDSSWAAVGGLRYIWSDLDITQEETASFDFKTLSFSVGIAYSF